MTLPQAPLNRSLLTVLVAVAIFATGMYVGFNRAPELGYAQTILNKEEGKPGSVDFALFWKVWNELETKYVSPSNKHPQPSEQDRVYGAIKGLVNSYEDPYTVFFPPVESKEFEQEISGAFEGIGAEIGIKGEDLTVVAPLKDSPAYRAGLKSNDIIIAIDGKSAGGLSVDEAIKLIRGEKGTVVELTIIRDKQEPQKIRITRDVISIPTVETKNLGNGVFKISLYNFSEQSPAKFRTALGEFVQSNSNKLILDLRGNPGGYLEAANDIASWFLPKGTVVVTEENGKNGEPVVYSSKRDPLFNKNLKMVVLVDGGSASASEILAGALSEHGVATMIGTKTFGKGTVQELVKVSPITSLKVTIARWLTPNGVSIADGGLEPKIKVERTEEDYKANRDPQLDAAVKFLLE